MEIVTLRRSMGRYEVIRELGRGGMGVVYEVRDPAVDRRLALKLLGADARDEALTRFRREAELMARVNHPHVVRVHALDVAPEGAFLVTDLVEGEELKAVTRRGPLAPEQGARLVRTLADAVEALHAQRVLHRDLKPQNVIVRPDGGPVLLDFGIARDLSDRERLTRTGALVGTPAYMAPEQAEGVSPSTLGPTVDVHALGALLVEVLTGQPPFDEGGGPMATLKRVMFEAPRWPAAARPGTPHALDAICRVAMSKAPAERYPTAAALRADLDRFLAGAAPRALERFPPPSSGLGLLLGALSAAVVLAAALVTGVLAAAADEAPEGGSIAVETSAARAARRPSLTTAEAPSPADAPITPMLEGGLLLPHPDDSIAEDVSARFVDDDTVITWGREDGHLRVWSLEAPEAPLAARTFEGEWALDVAAAGDVVFVRTTTRVLRLDARTLEGDRSWTIPGDPPWSPGEEHRPLLVTDGPAPRLLVPTSPVVHVLDPEELAPRAALPLGLRFPVASAALAGGRLFVGSGVAGDEKASQLGSGELHELDLDTGQVRRRCDGFASTVHGLAAAGEPPLVALGFYSGFLALWREGSGGSESVAGPGSRHPRTGELIDQALLPTAHSKGHVLGVALLPGELRLVSIAGGYKELDPRNEVRTWRADGTPLRWRAELARPPRSLALSPGGRRLVVGTGRGHSSEARRRGHPDTRWIGAEVWEVEALERELRPAPR